HGGRRQGGLCAAGHGGAAPRSGGVREDDRTAGSGSARTRPFPGLLPVVARRMNRMLRQLFDTFASLKPPVGPLLLLALLPYLGTLAQIEPGLFESQRRYFDSWLVLHPVRELKVPLP